MIKPSFFVAKLYVRLFFFCWKFIPTFGCNFRKLCHSVRGIRFWDTGLLFLEKKQKWWGRCFRFVANLFYFLFWLLNLPFIFFIGFNYSVVILLVLFFDFFRFLFFLFFFDLCTFTAFIFLINLFNNLYFFNLFCSLARRLSRCFNQLDLRIAHLAQLFESFRELESKSLHLSSKNMYKQHGWLYIHLRKILLLFIPNNAKTQVSNLMKI